MRTVGVTQAIAKDNAVTGMPLQRERQKTAGGEHAVDLGQHEHEIGNVNHGVRSENKIGACVRSCPQPLQHVVDLELGVKPGGLRLLDHAGRQIDTDEMIDFLGKGSGRKAGAAAKIDRALEEGGLLYRVARRQHRLEQQRRPAIAEIVHQRAVESRRVLIEQRPHIGRWHA
jgi:hypothetical protein